MATPTINDTKNKEDIKTCLYLLASPSDIANPKDRFIPKEMSKTSIVEMMRISDPIYEAVPIAEGPANFAPINQKTYVKIDVKNVQRVTCQIFFPTFTVTLFLS
jgi:hypothetical protein